MSLIRELLVRVDQYKPLEDDEIEKAHEAYDGHYNDTLDRGIGLGERSLADEIRAIIESNT